MKAGIGSFAFRYAIGDSSLPPEDRMTLKELLEFCYAEKIKAVQICENIPLHKITENELQDSLMLTQSYNIVTEIGTTGFSSDHLRRYIEIAKFFNARILRTVLSTGNKVGSKEEIRQSIMKIMPLLETYGITLAIENHFDLKPSDLRHLVEQINHPLVRICIDSGNSISLLCGTEETLYHLKEFIVSAHVKDMKVKRSGCGFLISGSPLGEGIADVTGYAKEVYKANSGCNIFLEQWMEPLDNIKLTIEEERKWATDGMRRLGKIVSGLNSLNE